MPTPTPPPPPPSKRRVRTESQMNQKRLADRLSHKERRKENKERIGKIEDDIADIKASLQTLTTRLQAPSPAMSSPAHSLNPGYPLQISNSCITRPGGRVDLDFHAGIHNSADWSAFVPTTQSQGNGPTVASSDFFVSSQTDLWSLLSPPNPTKVLNCRCGVQHLDRFDCMDACNVTTMYQRHTVFPRNPAMTGALPRNPSLPAMMLHSMDENPATFFITGFLRQFGAKSLEQLLGFYLIGYRYMRWLMQPTEETMHDVPSWLLPTEMQKTHPHSVCVDYLPWPSLRDYLCVSGDVDSRHSISFYYESIVLVWPPGRPILAQGDTGQVSLSSDFESVVNNLENWSMGPPWSDAFPHLMHLIHA